MSEQPRWQQAVRSAPLAVALVVALGALGLTALSLYVRHRNNDPAVKAAIDTGLQAPVASGLDLALGICSFLLITGAMGVGVVSSYYRAKSGAAAAREAEVQRLVESHTGRATQLLRLRRAELVNLAIKIENLRAVATLTEQDAAGLQQVVAGELAKNERAGRGPRRREALFWYLLGLISSIGLFLAGR